MPRIIFFQESQDAVVFSPEYIEIDWTASLTPTVIEYNIYRGLVSGGPYSLIGTVLANVNQFLDFNVASGVTYFYVVTSFDGSNESVNSNEASATA